MHPNTLLPESAESLQAPESVPKLTPENVIPENIEVAEIKIIAKRREPGRVLFDVDGGGEVTLPNKLLPKDIGQGEILVVEVLRENQHIARKADIAKALLNEILNTNEKPSQENQENKK